MERKVIVIVGPTCSGKTGLAISLAEKLGTEIISADSRQIFKYLNIGTAKPGKSELQRAKHHFIDLLDPLEEYNVSKFETDALSVIDELLKNGKVPIVAGGSGLYIRALIDGIFNSVDVDTDYREELKKKREEFGIEHLYNLLKEVDPESASKMLPQNWKRVMRALEVFHLTGEPIWKFQNNYERRNVYNFVQFGLNWDRATLYKNIELRIDDMMKNGLIDEVKSLLSRGLPKNLNALNTVGYKEIISYLDNEITLDRAVELIKRNTRHYAKRQLTWFRKDDRIKWLQINSRTDLVNAADFIVNNF